MTNVVQTPDGFLWASTLGGLARFDGVRFRVFDTATNPELPTSRLGAVSLTVAGEIWVVTQDRELVRFDGGRFHKIGPADGLPGGRAIDLSSRSGHLAVTTLTGTAVEKNGQLVPDTRPVPSPSLRLRGIGGTPDGPRWYLDRAGRAHRYDGDRLTRTTTLPAERADLVYEDRAGRLWMRSLRTGELLCVIGDEVHRYGAKDGVGSISTMWVYEDPDGTIWFAEQSGLVRFRDGRFRTFTKADGLPDNYVNSVFRDREGSLWVATQRGLARMTEQSITTHSFAQGLVAKNTYPILQDRRGDIWIGGWAGLTRYRNGVFEDVTVASGIANGNVLSLAETRDGAILVGLYGTGARRLTIDGATSRISAAVVKCQVNVIYAMHEDRRGDLWLGGDEGAVRCRNGVVDPPLPQTSGASAFYEDDQGALWIGHTAGLARYADGALTRFGAAEGFAGKRVRMIHPGTGGTLWLGTYDTGLLRYRDGKFTSYTTAEGLPANGAFQILEDQQKRFWISSNSGIYRVPISELDDVAAGRRRRVTAVRYGRDDGMANEECNGLGRPAGLSATDGRFWFPTQDGVVVVDPRTVGSQVPPPVSILDAEAGGFPVSSLDRIEIRSGSTSFQAHYTALTFVRPELAQFKYRMEGLDAEWIDAGIDRTARYARLPYGDFRFRVIAANRDGVWNEEGASIAVSVVPPFWKTRWFMALMLSGVLTAGFGVHRFRVGVLERKQAVQQAFARQLIDSQETDRRRIAAELHDGVSQTLVVIKNWARIVEKTMSAEDPARRKLTEIEGAATQALGEVREVVQDLVPYHLERMGLSEAIRESAARVADASGIQITCDLADLRSELNADTSLKIYRVVQEGLNNIVKHSGARTASFELKLDAGQARLTVRDDGKGFDPDAVAPTTAGDGFGLVGMQERARMMGGDMTVVSAPGQGTTITIVVPAAQ